ncbi:MAG: single-stranded-DNA-specific exonuclease RecJ [Oscillospiraceae bacterium]|nr:single-stranded-DNA-specific exonuclease RecJ [Oscillospiraceae bacterium]
MQKNWKIGSPDPQAVEALRRQGGITKLCAEVLVSRGITSVERAGAFLDAEALSDPFLIMDMDKAADRILQAVESGERICVYGDYDCDGVTATVMLTDWLTYAGADVSWYIPTRKEGYGIREEQIRQLAEEGVSLIITVDNGISAVEEAKLIRSLGMELVITDHHRPGDVLPDAVAVVDPHRSDCPSPYKSLCGAGVVLKLIAALEGGDCEPALEQFGDLAALATIADVVQLDGENRYLVKRGLQLLPNTERMGLLSLMAVCAIDLRKPITATMAAFQLIPRINAAGRFASASIAARLFLTDDPEEATLLAAQIHTLNDDRRATERVILEQIMTEIRSHPQQLHARVLVFVGQDWHHGVVGIVAARLMERFGKPCFLLSREEGEGYRGSARSFGEFSVFDCLHACADTLMRYGGHPGAGGFTVAEEQLARFIEGIHSYAAKAHKVMPVMTMQAVRALSSQDLTVQNVEGLQILEPYGAGNARPVFALLNATVQERIALAGGQYTKLRVSKDQQQLELLIFRCAPEETGIVVGMQYDFLVAPEVRPFQGRSSLSIRAEEWRIAGIPQAQIIAAEQAYEAYRRGEALPEAYYQRMCPSREDLVAVYQAVSHEPMLLALLCRKLYAAGMNYCRARLCADIFEELSLLSYDAIQDQVQRLPVTEKRSLTESLQYQKILQLAGKTVSD